MKNIILGTSLLTAVTLTQGCKCLCVPLAVGAVGVGVGLGAAAVGFTAAGGGAVIERTEGASRGDKEAIGKPYYSFRKHVNDEGFVDSGWRFISMPGDLIIGTVMLPFDLTAAAVDRPSKREPEKDHPEPERFPPEEAPLIEVVSDEITGKWSWDFVDQYLYFHEDGRITSNHEEISGKWSSSTEGEYTFEFTENDKEFKGTAVVKSNRLYVSDLTSDKSWIRWKLL